MTQWRWMALRHVTRTACDGPFGSAIKSDHYVEEGARVVRLGNIGHGQWIDSDSAFLPTDYWASLRQHDVRGGDILLAGLGDDNNSVGRATVAPDLGPALVKADCFRFRLDRTSAEPRFVSYFLCSAQGLAASQMAADGSTRKRLTLSKALSLIVPIPTLPDQRAIADYLDTETAHIDALIAKKRRMIEVMASQREAVLATETSGAGLSGTRGASKIPWLASVPMHWGQTMLKLVATLGSGHTPSRSHPEWWVPEECTIPWVTTGEVAQMRSDRIEYLVATREKISPTGMANSSACLHPANTVVLCRTASAGYSAIIAAPMAVSQDIAAWTCGPALNPRFLLLCLRAMRPDLLGRLAMGSTHKTIYMPDIESIRVPIPPLDEQDQIVVRVWGRARAIDKATDAIERQIELLNERRQALITAAVTGELAIPGVAA